MAKGQTVDIVVKIKDQFSEEIKSLKKQLRTIQNNVDVDLELTDGGDIDWAKMELDSIDNLIDVLVDIDANGLAEVIAKLQYLDQKDTDSTHTVNYREGGFQRRMRNFSEFGSSLPPPVQDFIGGQFRDGDGNFGTKRMEKMGLPDTIESNLPAVWDRDKNLPTIRPPQIDAREAIPSQSLIGPSDRRRALKRRAFKAVDGIGKAAGKFDGKLKGLMPTMRKWTNLLAALLPMMITLGVQALGVASAFGAVAVAGGAMIAGGLLGYGDNLADSMKKAKQRIGEFKKEIFATFKPTFKTFQPITESFLDRAPGVMQELARSMKSLTAFEGTVFESFEGLSDWVAEALDRMVAMEPILSQLAMRFGDIIGTGIIEFLEWLTVEAYENQNSLIALGSVFMDILGLVYDLSKFVSNLALEFDFLVDIAQALTDLIQNDFVMAMLKGTAVAYGLAKAIGAIQKAAVMLMNTTPLGAIMKLGLMVGSLVAAEELMSPNNRGPTYNGGASGGPVPAGRGSSGGNGGGGSTYVMNVRGSVGSKQMNKFRNLASGVYSAEEEDEDWKTR